MPLPIARVVLYKHGVGYFEREGKVDGASVIALTFKQNEVSDVLKSLTVLDLDGGHIASVSYDSTKPLEQLLAEVALSIPDQGSLVSLLPQIKGARVALLSGIAERVEGTILGIDTTERRSADGVVRVVLLSILSDQGEVRSIDLHSLSALQLLDPVLKRDLDFYLKTQLSAKKKDARTFSFFAQGEGERRIRVSYTLEAPVWKATYRILLGEENAPPMIQGWAVVDNMQDEDWDGVELCLIAGLPVSFIHDLYTPRYIRRPEVEVQETTGVLPPTVEEGLDYGAIGLDSAGPVTGAAGSPNPRRKQKAMLAAKMEAPMSAAAMRESTPTQVRERKVGDLFEYRIEHPVTIKRNQSALVPIVQRDFAGRPVLLYNKATRAENPMRCVEFKNTTGLTLEGGPLTVLETGNYVGEAMLETTKPDEERLVPYCVELSVRVFDNLDSRNERVHRVIIRDGKMQAEYLYVQQRTYRLDNKSDAARVVYLEHPRGNADFELFETPVPHEITENHWRFRFTVEPKKTTAFVVKARQTLCQVHALADFTDNQLSYWLEQKYVDGRTAELLQNIAAQRHEAASLDMALKMLEQDRQSIHTEQKRIRENLQSIGDRPGEKELRERYLKTLNAQEDRLDAIDKDAAAKHQERHACREKMALLIAKLEYEAAV